MTITGNIERFQYFNFKINLLKNANPFQKTGETFLVESTKTDKITFQCKTALSEAIAKTNGKYIMNLESKITKNGVVPVTTFFFRKYCSSLRTSYIELIWYTNYPNVLIHTFQKRCSLTWGYFFPVSFLNKSRSES